MACKRIWDVGITEVGASLMVDSSEFDSSESETGGGGCSTSAKSWIKKASVKPFVSSCLLVA